MTNARQPLKVVDPRVSLQVGHLVLEVLDEVCYICVVPRVPDLLLLEADGVELVLGRDGAGGEVS